MMLLGVVGVGSHNALAYLGLNYTTAINGVILNSFIPVMIIALSWIFLRQRLSGVQLAGVMVSLVGRADDPVARAASGRWRRFGLNRGDLLGDSVDAAVVDLHDLPALAAARAAHAHVPVRDRDASATCAMLPLYLRRVGDRPAHVRSRRPASLRSSCVALFSSVLAYIFWNRGVEAGRRERRRAVRPPDAGVRRRCWRGCFWASGCAVPRGRHRAHPERHLRHQPRVGATHRDAARLSARGCVTRVRTRRPAAAIVPARCSRPSPDRQESRAAFPRHRTWRVPPDR